MSVTSVLVYSAVVIIIGMISVEAEDACSSGMCHCKHKHVWCQGLNLTYIPAIPRNTRLLKFDHNDVANITKKMMANITIARLWTLQLTYSKIQAIEKDAFVGFRYLRVLYLTGNVLSLDAIYNVIRDIRTSLVVTLDLSANSLKHIPIDLFHGMDKSRLRNLYLSGNKLKIVNYTAFTPIRGLLQLNINNNHLQSNIMDYNYHLSQLSLVSNNLKDIPDMCDDNGTSYFPKLTTLRLSRNVICEIIPEHLNCLKKLFHLDLNLNCIATFKTGSFSQLPDLKWLSLEDQHNPKHWFNIEMFAFNNSNLGTIILRGNHLEIKHIHRMAFVGCVKLRYLELSRNRLTDDTHEPTNRLNSILSHLRSLRVLLMFETTLKSIPEVIGTLYNLKSLDIRYNGIKSWPDKFWSNNTKLTKLQVDNNIIQYVTKEMFPAKLRDGLKSIGLSENPFICTCGLVWFIEWVNEDTNKTFLNYPRYKCLNITAQICLNNTPAFYSIIAVSCLLLFVTVTVSLVYKYRWFIKYQIYIWRHQPHLLLSMANRPFVYDVFVSYCEQDSDWIFDYVIPKLENEDNIKLCIHQRDFQAGRLIIDNIVQSIEGSRRVLLVLSNSFVLSEWCLFEMALAQKHVFDLNMESIIIVLLEEIDSVHMNTSLHTLMKTTTYITWPDDPQSIQLFWDRLRQSLGTS